jgi:putative transposase
MQREKVSIAGALALSPRRRRVRLLFQLLIKAYFNNVQVADFLHCLARQLRGPLIVIWDGGTMHKGDPIRQALHQLSPRVTLEPLPPYAPMLNPVEPVWAWLKYDRLQNFAPEDAYHLAAVVEAELDAICRDDSFLRRLWQGSDLLIPPALTLLS